MYKRQALVPLYLGVRAVIAKSFARIHAANLINAGIMPLTFENPDDYDKISQDDTLRIEHVYYGMDEGKMVLKDVTTGAEIPLSCSFTERQKAILKAGGLLKYVGPVSYTHLGRPHLQNPNLRKA